MEKQLYKCIITPPPFSMEMYHYGESNEEARDWIMGIDIPFTILNLKNVESTQDKHVKSLANYIKDIKDTDKWKNWNVSCELVPKP